MIKVDNRSDRKFKFKKLILIISAILYIGIYLLCIDREESKKVAVQQEDDRKQEQLRKEIEELMSKEPQNKKGQPKTLFDGIEFNYVDEETKRELEEQLVYILNAVCENNELREFHKRVDITFMITSNIMRLAREQEFPVPKAVGIAGADSFYFVGRSPKGQIEQFIILDTTVFETDMKLLVVLMHESIHARNFVMGLAKKDFVDEEIQVCEQTIESLEGFYDKVNLEKLSPEMAQELKILIIKEKNVLTTFRHNKNLKRLLEKH